MSYVPGFAPDAFADWRELSIEFQEIVLDELAGGDMFFEQRQRDLPAAGGDTGTRFIRGEPPRLRPGSLRFPI